MFPGYRFFFRVAIFAVVTALPFNVYSADPFSTHNISPPQTELGQALHELVSKPGGPPGIIVLIQRGSNHYLHTAGVANIETGLPPRAREHMRIASVSKAFSGAVARSLVVDGVLGLEDTIGGLLPDLPINWHPVTLRQALNHTSGLPDYTSSPAFREMVSADPTHAPPPLTLLKTVADQQLEFNPGSAYNYSNSDNIVIALMIEQVTGLDYAAALQKYVLLPLRLNQSSLPAVVELPQPFIRGYQLDDSGNFEDVSENIAFGGYAWASGGIVSSPANLSRFVRAYVSGRLFGIRKWKQRVKFVEYGESKPPGPGINSAGPGIFRYQTRCGTVFGHTGSILGYTQFIAATNDGKASVVFSVNSQVGKSVLPALRYAQELAVCEALDRVPQ